MKWATDRDRNRPIADHVLIELGWLLVLVLVLVVLVVSLALYRSNVTRDLSEAKNIANVVALDGLLEKRAGRVPRLALAERLGPLMEQGFVLGWYWHESGSRPEIGGAIRRDDTNEYLDMANRCLEGDTCDSPDAMIGPPWAPRPVVVAGNAALGNDRAAVLLWVYPREPAFLDELRSPWLIGYLVSVVLLLTGLGWWRLRTLIAQPLSRLIGVMKSVEAGDYRARASEYTCREMVELTGQFNQMAEAMDSNRQELERRVHELESAYREIERARDEAIQSEKLAGVGRLAAGIAHEVGNPLAAMTGFAELLEDETLDPATRKDLLKRIQADLARTDRIIRSLLDYARTGSREDIQFSPSQVVESAIELCRGRRLFDHIQVVYTGSTSGMCWGDPGQIEQIIINLMLNAVDAMGGRGQIDLSVRDASDGRSVEIRVTDRGPGIRREDLVKIFDPFFTTKEPGKGTGLGLAIADRLAESHGGRLTVESTSSQGTTFLLVLPTGNPATSTEVG